MRNRIHALLARQKELELPRVSDVFGKAGMRYLEGLRLTEPDGTLLRQDLEELQLLQRQIKEIESHLDAGSDDAGYERYLMGIPGLGRILSNVIAVEIDRIERFSNSDKLCAYSGLVPSTYASGGKHYHGCLLRRCNKWLKWAFIEAAWVSVGCCSYFDGLYKYQLDRGKKPSEAIVAVARRLCKIVWCVLTDKRAYEDRPFLRRIPGRSIACVTVH